MTSITDAVRDRVRTALNIRKPRKVDRKGPRPGVGAKIVKDDLRMTVQAGMNRELWSWLQEQGWREVFFRPDRRHYRDIPNSWVTRLTDATIEQRPHVLAAAMARATDRSPLKTVRSELDEKNAA